MASAKLCIEVIYSPCPGQVVHCPLQLDLGSSVSDAVHESGLPERFPELQTPLPPCGVWGQRSGLSALLRDRDRVEIYRPLNADPKDARRLRQQRNTRNTRNTRKA
jgi:uncharacterized protein